ARPKRAVRASGSSVARAAPEARTGGNICSCGAAVFVCAFRRSASLYLFGGETSVAFVLAAKLGREARRENEDAYVASARLRESGGIETGWRRSRFLLPACGEKD